MHKILLLLAFISSATLFSEPDKPDPRKRKYDEISNSKETDRPRFRGYIPIKRDRDQVCAEDYSDDDKKEENVDIPNDTMSSGQEEFLWLPPFRSFFELLSYQRENNPDVVSRYQYLNRMYRHFRKEKYKRTSLFDCAHQFQARGSKFF